MDDLSEASSNEDLESVTIQWLYGWNTKTVDYISDHKLCFVCGNHVVFTNEDGSEDKIFTSPGIGLGAFAANKYDHLFAFSDISADPCIYIYKYPSFEKLCELRDGGELSIAALTFSWNIQIASLSTIPDLKLTVWRWTPPSILCSHQVALDTIPDFQFNPINWRQLATASPGVLTVWDILYFEKGFVLNGKDIRLPLSESKQKPPKPPDYVGLKMPAFGFENAQKYLNKLNEKLGVNECHPTALSWLPNGDILVGTRDGEIYKIDTDKMEATLIWVDSLCFELNAMVSINAMVLHRSGLFVAAERQSHTESVDAMEDRRLRLKSSNETDHLAEGFLIKLNTYTPDTRVLWIERLPDGAKIKRMKYNESYTHLVLSYSDGSIRMFSMAASHQDEFKIIFEPKEKIICADFLPPGNKWIVTLNDRKEVKVRRMTENPRDAISSVELPENCTVLACSPLWNGASVGTLSGTIYTIDFAAKTLLPRVIHAVRPDSKPVEKIKYDATGYMQIIVIGPNIFVMSARPSQNFSLFGYISVQEPVLDVESVTDMRSDLHIMILHKENNKPNANTLLTKFQLPRTILLTTARNMTNIEGSFDETAVKKKSWIYNGMCFGLGVGITEKSFYTFEEPHKLLMHLTLTEYLLKDSIYSKANPKTVWKSYHELDKITLVSNSAQGLIITLGNDGKLVCRCLFSPDDVYISYATGFLHENPGLLILSRSTHHILIVTPCNNLILYYWNYIDSGTKKSLAIKELPEANRENMAAKLKNAFITGFTTISEETTSSQTKAATLSRKAKTTPKAEARTEIPHLDTSWIDSKRAGKYQMEEEQYGWQVVELKKSVKELGHKVAKLLLENDLLPEKEQIPRQEFEMDKKTQTELVEANSAHLLKIREDALLKNLLNGYLWRIIKNECWDGMYMKGKSIAGFFKNFFITNFPLKNRTPEELKKLERVTFKRKVELNGLNYRIKQGQAEQPRWLHPTEEAVLYGEQSDIVYDPKVRQLHLGSYCMDYGGDNPLHLSQFEVFTKDQKHHQIVLGQDCIYRMKMYFNKIFDELYSKKQATIAKINERCNRMHQITADINLRYPIWEPLIRKSEKPDECLIVLPQEIKSEKYISPEEKEAIEKKRLEEEEQRLRKLEDDFRHRALVKMMGGVLAARREDEILKKDVPIPAFMEKKPKEHFNEQEVVLYKEYELKVRELNEEREKLRKQLEVEFHRSADQTKELGLLFDEDLQDVFQKKIDTTFVVLQEEQKLTRINLMLALEEDIYVLQENLVAALEILKKKKASALANISHVQKRLQSVHEVYEHLIVEDKIQEKAFKKEFGDQPPLILEALTKLLRRKPRLPRGQVHTISQVSGDNPYGGGPFGEAQVRYLEVKEAAALVDMDNVANMPEIVGNVELWEQFCISRRNKMASEQQVRDKSTIIADMMSYQDAKQQAHDVIAQNISDVNELIMRLQSEKRRILMNLDIQVLMKAGNVELTTDGYLPDFDEVVLIHRRIVEERNKTILALGQVKIQGMVENLKMQNAITLQEWEHKRMQMTLEDLIRMAKEIQRLQVTREMMWYLQQCDNSQLHISRLSKLEETIRVVKEMHQKILLEKEKDIAKKHKVKESLDSFSDHLQDEMFKLNTIISQWKLIPNMDDPLDKKSSKNFEVLTRRRKLAELAEYQSELLNMLLQEVDAVLDKSHSFYSSASKTSRKVPVN